MLTFSNPTAAMTSLSYWEGENGGGSLSTPGNWANGIGVGLSAISVSVGRAIKIEEAYLNTASLIKSTQTMLKVGPANLLVNSATASKGLLRAGIGLAVVSAGFTAYDAYNKGEWKGHHTADLIVNGALTGISYAFPVAGLTLGATYFVLDMGYQYYTGKSITEYYFDK